ncbi:MAG: response regulator [Candidatus Accumulibacter sp.]|nr:response regulator [Accumulibacter sp.]
MNENSPLRLVTCKTEQNEAGGANLSGTFVACSPPGILPARLAERKASVCLKSAAWFWGTGFFIHDRHTGFGENVSRELIIIVDDNLVNLQDGKDALSDRYKVLTFNSAATMLRSIDRFSPALILLDVDMPEMGGYEAIKVLKNRAETKDVPVIFLTGMSDAKSEMTGLELGAVDYITKPFSPPLLKKRVELHLLFEANKRALIERNDILQDIATAKSKTIGVMQNKLLQTTAELIEKRELSEQVVLEYNDNLQDMETARSRAVGRLQNKLLQVMAELIERRDNVIGSHHIARTLHCLKVMLEAMKESKMYDEDVKTWNFSLLLRSSQLHDIGNIGISDNILKKPGKLTNDEFEAMKEHVDIGVGLIKRLDDGDGGEDGGNFLRYARIFAEYHHEKWDGSGYPKGLAGKKIPLLGRVMAIADVYEVLTSERPYKQAFTHEEAVRIILEGKGKHFDPELVTLFEQVADRLRVSQTYSAQY